MTHGRRQTAHVHANPRQVEACRVRVRLPSLLCVVHAQLHVTGHVCCFLSIHVAHAGHLVAAVAAVLPVWIVRRARARRWIARKARRRPLRCQLSIRCSRQTGCRILVVSRCGLQRTRIHIVLPRAVVEGAILSKLSQIRHHPRTRAHVGEVVVVSRCPRKRTLARLTLTAAPNATSILDRQHLLARLDAIAERATVAVDRVVIDKLKEVQPQRAQRPHVGAWLLVARSRRRQSRRERRRWWHRRGWRRR